MPAFGACAPPERSAELKSAGFDYLEIFAAQALADDNDDPVARSSLPVPAANGMLPGDLRIVGDDVDFPAVEKHLQGLFGKLGKLDIRTQVFGSGRSRMVPGGFDRDEARQQTERFLRTAGDLAATQGVMLVIEPLRSDECNIINTVGEAMQYVRSVDHPHVKCLIDTYHFWVEDEPLENVSAAVADIRHVHVADRDGRTAPGDSGTSDYGPVFAVLKKAGYDGGISLEGADPVGPDGWAGSLAFLRDAWNNA